MRPAEFAVRAESTKGDGRSPLVVIGAYFAIARSLKRSSDDDGAATVYYVVRGQRVQRAGSGDEAAGVRLNPGLERTAVHMTTVLRRDLRDDVLNGFRPLRGADLAGSRPSDLGPGRRVGPRHRRIRARSA